MAVDMSPKLWGSIGIVIDGDLNAVSMLPNGGYLVASRSNGRISFQIYNGNGDKVSAHTVDGPTAGTLSQWQPDIFTNTDGTFVITWTEAVGNGTGSRVLRSQKFGIDGQALNQAQTLSQAAKGDGVVVATNGQAGSMTAYVKEVVANTTFRLTLLETPEMGASTETVLNVDAATGKMGLDWLGNEIGYAVSYLTTDGLRISTVKNGVVTTYNTAIANISESELVALKDANGNPTGKFVVTYVDGWTYQVAVDTFHLDTNTNSIVRDSTVPLGPRTTDSSHLKTSITALHDGGYAVAYKGQAPDGDQRAEIYVEVVDSEGHAGPTVRIPVNGHQGMPAISEMADGRLAVSWHDPSLGVGAVETVIVDARAAAVTGVGTAGNDIYAPSKHVGDDFNGGDGIDTLTFQGASAGVTVNLAAESGSAGDATGDTYKNFENIIGSRFNDNLTGNALSNTLQGGAGNDVLNGGSGADRLEGGGGNDVYVVDNAGDRVIETSTGGTDLVYTYISYTAASFVENLYATGSSAITLTGNSLANVIKGNAAANKIYGGAGNDILYGGAGKDTFVFNAALNAKTNKDLIRDWDCRYDTIQLENAIFKKLTKTGMLNTEFFVTGAAAKDANDYIGYNPATGDLWYDSNGSAAGGQVVFANIGKNKPIYYNDFVVI